MWLSLDPIPADFSKKSEASLLIKPTKQDAQLLAYAGTLSRICYSTANNRKVVCVIAAQQKSPKGELINLLKSQEDQLFEKDKLENRLRKYELDILGSKWTVSESYRAPQSESSLVSHAFFNEPKAIAAKLGKVTKDLVSAINPLKLLFKPHSEAPDPTQNYTPEVFVASRYTNSEAQIIAAQNVKLTLLLTDTLNFKSITAAVKTNPCK